MGEKKKKREFSLAPFLNDNRLNIFLDLNGTVIKQRISNEVYL